MTVLRRWTSPMVVGLVVLLVLLAVWGSPRSIIREGLRERTFDWLLPLLRRPVSHSPEVVIVDIDRAALAQFGPWPWPRQHLADIVSVVASAQPLAIGLDILLASPDRFAVEGDAALARALSSAPTVLGFVLDTSVSRVDLPSTPILSRGPVTLPGIWRAEGVIGPLPTLADAAQGLGGLVAAADPDGLIRRVPLLVMGDVVRPGLAVEMIRVGQELGELLIDAEGVLHVGTVAVALGQDAALRLSGMPTARVIPVLGLLGNADARAGLSGRLVLIGSSAPELGGLRATPASPVTPSVQIQAAAVEAMLDGNVEVRPSWAWFGEPIAAFGLGLICLVLAAATRPLIGAACAGLLGVMWAVAAVAAAPGLSLLVDPAGPPIVAVSAFAAATLLRFAQDEWRARILRMSFEQHLAPEVVRRIAANPGALRLRGEMREITALFTDIEGFTTLTERAEPGDLVALLDAYFDVATRIITDHGGMIDKIVGDAIHAFYNAPFEIEDHPKRAVASALALIEATETVRQSALGQRLGLGRTRIGIETGPAIVGDVGGSRKLDYTAHGNAVNAAARLEAANKELGSSICIGPGSAARLDPATLRQIGRLTLRGQSQEIDVYTPISLESQKQGG